MEITQNGEIVGRVESEYRLAVKHLGVTRYAELLGITLTQLKQVHAASNPRQVVRWSVISEEVLRAAFDDFQRGREIATRFCARHGYSASGFTQAMRSRWPDEWERVTGEKRPEAGRLYKIGRDLERRTRLRLMEADYFVVRSPASKSKVDLTAVRAGEILLIQCKRNGVIPKDEWNKLWEISIQAGGIPLVVENPWSGRTNWWRIIGPKTKRGEKPWVPYMPPIPVRTVDIVEIDDEDSPEITSTFASELSQVQA